MPILLRVQVALIDLVGVDVLVLLISNSLQRAQMLHQANLPLECRILRRTLAILNLIFLLRPLKLKKQGVLVLFTRIFAIIVVLKGGRLGGAVGDGAVSLPCLQHQGIWFLLTGADEVDVGAVSELELRLRIPQLLFIFLLSHDKRVKHIFFRVKVIHLLL